MGVQGREWGPLLLRELNRRVISDPVSANSLEAGEAVGLDALQVAAAMTWLVQHRYVMTQGDEDDLPDPYTEKPLAPTYVGLAFLEAHPF